MFRCQEYWSTFRFTVCWPGGSCPRQHFERSCRSFISKIISLRSIARLIHCEKSGVLYEYEGALQSHALARQVSLDVCMVEVKGRFVFWYVIFYINAVDSNQACYSGGSSTRRPPSAKYVTSRVWCSRGLVHFWLIFSTVESKTLAIEDWEIGGLTLVLVLEQWLTQYYIRNSRND